MTIYLGISDEPFVQSSSGLHAEYMRSVTASAPQGSVLSPIFFQRGHLAPPVCQPC